jgi:CheY-like chemotaxis protein
MHCEIRLFWHGNGYCGPGFCTATMSEEDARKWILIVDDDSSVRLMLARVLYNEGYGVLTAASGGDALGLATTMAVDLLLLDLSMPGMDGWKTLAQLEAKKLAPPPPVIIITARPNQQAAGRKAGVVAVLEKPLDFPRLIQTVSQVLAKAVNSTNAA